MGRAVGVRGQDSRGGRVWQGAAGPDGTSWGGGAGEGIAGSQMGQ